MTPKTLLARALTSTAMLFVATSVIAQDSPTAVSSVEAAAAAGKCPVMGPVNDASNRDTPRLVPIPTATGGRIS